MDQIKLEPYIFFNGNAREAMNFYKDVLGGELHLQTNEDVHAASEERPADQLMHARLEGGVAVLMASDTVKASPKAAKVSLSLTGSNEAKLRDIFDALSENVDVQQPLKKEFWGDIFGSVTDKYGVEWMVNISVPKEAAAN